MYAIPIPPQPDKVSTRAKIRVAPLNKRKSLGINKCIDLLKQGQPFYATHTPELSYDAGIDTAQTWTDMILVDFEHHHFDIGGLGQFMNGLTAGGPTACGHLNRRHNPPAQRHHRRRSLLQRLADATRCGRPSWSLSLPYRVYRSNTGHFNAHKPVDRCGAPKPQSRHRCAESAHFHEWRSPR